MIHNLSNGQVYNDSVELSEQTENFRTYFSGLLSSPKLEAECTKESIGKNFEGTEKFRYTKEVYDDGVLKVVIDKVYQEIPSSRRALAIVNDGVTMNIQVK